MVSSQPNVEEQQLFADTRRRAEERLPARELLCEAVFGSGFLATVALLWVLDPPGSFAVAPAVICLAVFMLASRVRFETPFGFTVATQLAFVPLLFALPGPLVPLAVAAALTLARLPQVVNGEAPAQRLVRSLGNSWFSVGPVIVLAAAGTTPIHAGPALLVAMFAGQIAADAIASTIRNFIERGASLAAQLRDAWVYAIDFALSVIGLVIAEDLHRSPIVSLAALPLLALLAFFARDRAQRIESLIELNTAYRGTALVLGDVIEADDGYTGEHCKSVVLLAMDVTARLGLDAETRRNVEFAALLHDVGKIAIPKEIINKPGKLNADEWKVIETHTVEGQKMLNRIGGFMQCVGTIVRSHHERWDGGGYPDGLAGEQIPIEARIITACDSWNAMRTDRAYRTALPYETALAEMQANSNRQFDPKLVAVLLELVDETEGAAARLSQPEPVATQSGAHTETSAAGEGAGWGAPRANPTSVAVIVESIGAADGGNRDARSV
jgi:putative nucleotidyltransferase with HDIG domain